MGCDDERVNLTGFCQGEQKTIYLDKKQGKEDKINTVLHEGLHAILLEIGAQHELNGLCADEKAIYHLTAEILNYLKQTMTNFGPKV
jgi:hypothetical protein